jgi:hypothetical protein
MGPKGTKIGTASSAASSSASTAGVVAGVAAVVIVAAAVVVIRRRRTRAEKSSSNNKHQQRNDVFGFTNPAYENPVYELEEPMDSLPVIARRLNPADELGQATHYYPGNTLFAQ